MKAVWTSDPNLKPYVVPYCRFCNAPGGIHDGRGTFHWGACNNASPDGRTCECPKRLWRESGYDSEETIRR